jgi:hypothetical protein
MAPMVSYPGITRTVHVRLKWPADRYVQGLDFTTYVCIVEERREQSLYSACSTLMPVWRNANRDCLTKNYWSLFRMLGMCYDVFYVSYKIILRHLPRWMDCVLILLTVPSVQ